MNASDHIHPAKRNRSSSLTLKAAVSINRAAWLLKLAAANARNARDAKRLRNLADQTDQAAECFGRLSHSLRRAR